MKGDTLPRERGQLSMGKRMTQYVVRGKFALVGSTVTKLKFDHGRYVGLKGGEGAPLAPDTEAYPTYAKNANVFRINRCLGNEQRRKISSTAHKSACAEQGFNCEIAKSIGYRQESPID